MKFEYVIMYNNVMDYADFRLYVKLRFDCMRINPKVSRTAAVYKKSLGRINLRCGTGLI